LSFSAFCHSIVADFYLKTTGRADVYESTLRCFPYVELMSADSRALALNVLGEPAPWSERSTRN
ncbi:hypothetical protein, partial [Klebsiella pneumoniae]|uniref:hypothetical protein n=1 Tax=Klebsiella pneumoniae TaxID=573 RepID=UPI001FAE1C6D